MRDDFTKQTITEIAKGVGYRCSNPDCLRPTVGANAAQDGVFTIGVAAHICAASSGGPRYDLMQTSDQRRGKENGIWLCQNCGRLIDADPREFPVELLLGWKRAAQARAFREMVAPETSFAVQEASRVGVIVATDNASLAGKNFDAIWSRIHAAADTDLAAFRRTLVQSGATVELTLRILHDDSVPAFAISRLPTALEVAQEVVIVARPGTGKTTTLLQLASELIAGRSIVPVYFRLGDWSAGSLGLLDSLNQRPAFKDVALRDIRQIADRGRMLLLLDGWNELDPDARRRVRIELESIRRDYPYLRIIVTTRRQLLDVPVSGPRVAIEALSDDQQMEIARARSGAAGEKIVDEAWRTPGVRELIATPLYLTALLSLGAHVSSPTTKEEILRLFVEQHERATEHAEALQAVLFGCHSQVLAALASHMNAIGSTTVTEAEARRIITTAVSRLREQGQITTQPEPAAVLETLASHHTVIRSVSDSDAISFQHQQFQEWFGSYDVEVLMRASARSDQEAETRLRVDILDHPAWEESILFAVDRVSREGGGAEIVAHAVRLALRIDPMLAAEMIFRSAPAVWEIVNEEMMAFVGRWHRPEKIDRAVRFMIMTGRPEFEVQMWPLASNENTQTQIPALRSAPRFRPSVLGPGAPGKIAALREEVREDLLALIASESGVDGMDMATEIAKADPSPRVQAEVIQHLQFRRADRHVAELLERAHDATWSLVAKRTGPNEIANPDTAARLREERQKALQETSSPLEQIRLLLDQSADSLDRDAAIAAVIADPNFPTRDQNTGSLLFFAQEQTPRAVLDGFRRRLEAGLELPFHAEDLLSQLPVTDHGQIPEAVLDLTEGRRNANIAAMVVGPRTVGTLIDRCLESLKTARHDRSAADRYHQLESRVEATRPSSILSAVMARADTMDATVISGLSSLISRHGDHEVRKQSMPVPDEQRDAWINILNKWTEVIISSPDATRHDLCEVGNAIGRLGFRELTRDLKRLLDEDLARLRHAIEGFAEARRRGDIRATSDASMRYGNQYRQAFARIGGKETIAVASEYLEDRIFGFDAALILKAISDTQLNIPQSGVFRRWPWLDEVAAARKKRAASDEEAPANTLADPILAAIDRLAKPEIDTEGQLLAIQMARIALAMPHPNQDALMARVVALPQRLESKRELFAALALDGQVLEIDAIMGGIDDWLQDAEHDAWHRRQRAWEIEPWLELLPFTNRPDLVIEGLTKVKTFYGAGHPQFFERVLQAVGAVPGPEGESLLAALAHAHKDIARDYEWMKALLGREIASAVRLYVDLFVRGVFGRGPQAVDPWHAARELAPHLPQFPEIIADLRQRYETDGNARCRALFEHLVVEVGGEENLLAMVNSYAKAGRPYDHLMAQAIRAVTLHHQPVSEKSNVYYVVPVSVAGIRNQLFQRLPKTQEEAGLASKCLNEIDSLRDEYGIAAADTRHPDVCSGIPWPLEADQVTGDFRPQTSRPPG